MRYVTAFLLVLLGLVHLELWTGRSGVPRVVELSRDVAQTRAANDELRAANERLAAEVRDLQEGLEMIEEKARAELGMVKPDEILVQFAPAAGMQPRPAAAAPMQRTH